MLDKKEKEDTPFPESQLNQRRRPRSIYTLLQVLPARRIAGLSLPNQFFCSSDPSQSYRKIGENMQSPPATVSCETRMRGGAAMLTIDAIRADRPDTCAADPHQQGWQSG